MRSIRSHGLTRHCWFRAVVVLMVAGSAANLAAQVPGGPSAEVVNAPIVDDGGVTLAEQQRSEGLSLLWLISQGGLLMLPIYLASIVTIAVVIERLISLRRSRVLPRALLEELIPRRGDGEMDPRSAYRQCQNYPSPAANIIRTMLLKVGRPHSEVERAVAEASEREANRMYANVRWLNLVAAVTPLLGLLGTVWGMIRAFFDTTQLAIGQNKADYLAAGIYVALVTTLGGLAVAIPAAIFAHYFEGRIQRIIYHIDELLFNLLPHIERYEGRMRLNTSGALEEDLYGVSADGASNREKPFAAGGQGPSPSPGNAAAKTDAPPSVFDPPTSPAPPRQRRSTPS